MTPEKRHVLAAIATGELDESLDEIITIARARMKGLQTALADELRPGDTVRFKRDIRPQYLAGLTATVVRLNRDSAVLQAPADAAHKYRRFARGEFRCPFSLIEKEA